MRIQSKYNQIAVIGFSSWIWLVEKVEQFFWTNHITK